MDKSASSDAQPISRRYASWVLALLTASYVLNFIDRQILSILAEDIKVDLGLSDSSLGFLYGTMFGVFYALFGIPLGRLADSWNRVRLLSLGLGVWSLMTAVSGLARSGVELAGARFGVGVGEATASPSAYSLISDYFPKSKRATALAIYSSGIYIGAGLSLFIGGLVLVKWKAAFPGSSGPFGLAAWQATFFIVGLPGLLLALLISTLREPIRGQSEGVSSKTSAHPFQGFLNEIIAIVPPFTLVRAAILGRRAFTINAGFALFVALMCYGLFRITGDVAQWAAIGIGFYAVFSWSSSLRESDKPAFALIWGTPTFTYLTLGFGLISLIGYALSFWAASYARRYLGASPATIGLILGGASAVAGFLGIIVGGKLSDALRSRSPAGRINMVIACALITFALYALCFVSSNSTLFYMLVFASVFVSSMILPACGATTQDLVMPRMRGTATAAFFLGATLVGMALGPYLAGKISELSGELWIGLLSILVVAPVAIGCFLRAYVLLPKAEESRLERARDAGELLE